MLPTHTVTHTGKRTDGAHGAKSFRPHPFCGKNAHNPLQRNGLRFFVFPSGIIGPGDIQGGSFTSMAKSFLAGRLALAVRGGYDFVDVRDMAVRLMARKEKGEL